MLRSQELTKKSRIAFEWVLKANGAVMKAETHVRADHAKSQGVPLPDELAATIASLPLQKAACRAVKTCLDSAEESVYEDLECTYRGVVDEDTGEVLMNCKPKEVSLVAFEWALKVNGAIVKAATHVRADNAKSRGVPLPDELAAVVERTLLWRAASSAAERVTFEESDNKVLKGVECKYPAKSFLIFYAYSTIDSAREARAHHKLFAPSAVRVTHPKN